MRRIAALSTFSSKISQFYHTAISSMIEMIFHQDIVQKKECAQAIFYLKRHHFRATLPMFRVYPEQQ